MNILFTICARAGSKGVKNKNIKNFTGYPLPLYTASAISLYINRYKNFNYDIVLNTDSTDIIELFKSSLSLETHVIERDAELSTDHIPKIQVLSNCLDVIGVKRGVTYDMVLDLDITSPLRTIEDINNIIIEKQRSKADVVFSVTDSRRNPYFNMVKKTENGYERAIRSDFNTRQEAPEIFDMNASIYAYSPEFLMSHKSIFSGTCSAIKMYDTAVLDLDNENDFELMQVIAEYLFNKYDEFSEIRDHIKQIYCI